jgi:hypothetical protein
VAVSRREFLVVAGGLAASMAARPSHAYLLPGGYFVGLVAKTRSEMKLFSLDVASRVTVFSGGDGETGRFGTGRDALMEPELWRRETAIGSETTVASRRSGTVTDKAGTTRVPLSPLELFLTAPPGNDQFVAGLEALGIDLSVRHFDRFAGRFCYVLGAAPGQLDKPQVWFDKDRYQPLRFITPRKHGAETVSYEERTTEWTSPVTNGWYPRVVEIWHGGARTMRREATSLEVNTRLDPGLFK